MPSRPPEAAARFRTRLAAKEDESPAWCAGAVSHVVRTATGIEFMMKAQSLMGIPSMVTYLESWLRHVQHRELKLPETCETRRTLIRRIRRI